MREKGSKAVWPAACGRSAGPFSGPLHQIALSLYLGGQVSRLLANAQLADHVPVKVRIGRLQVVQQTAALAYQHQQTAPGGMVLLMRLEVFGQFANSFAENRDLHLGTSGIGVMGAKARDNFGFFLCSQHGGALPLYVLSRVHSLSVC